MRVLFLNPPFHPRFSREQRSPAVTKSGTLYYPKWLATAAGVAIKNGHEVDLVDAPAGGFSVQAVIDRIASKNIEAVVCDTSTPSILNDISVVEAMVAANPSLHVLMVGRHVSSLPKETLAMSPLRRGSFLGRRSGLAQQHGRNHQQQAARSHQGPR